MKERIAQLKTRYQNYSSREKNSLKICAAAICCAAIYYAGVLPLDNSIQSSKSTLVKQKEMQNWMRGYITYILPLIVLFIFFFGLYDKFF